MNKKRKLNASTQDPQTASNAGASVSAANVLNTEFERFCQVHLPDEFSDAEDLEKLRLCWMGACWHVSGQLLKGAVEPLHQVAGEEFQKLALKPIPAKPPE
jgi:hypothetical protein